MKVFYLFLMFSVLAFCGSVNKHAIRQKDGSYIMSNTVIMKTRAVLPGSAKQAQLPAALFHKTNGMGSISAYQMFPSTAKSNSGSLETIYAVEYSGDVDPFEVVEQVKKSGVVEWVEPRYLYETEDTPNDPSFGLQWGLAKVGAANAWNVTQGDTTVRIGIVDTGVEWTHPDLNGNVARNWAEIPNNGIDDDGNGYVDDYVGWDFGGLTGTPDNNPDEDRADHGTHVAGIAAAVTNNGVGIAGLAYKCKILCVKTAQDNVRNDQNEALISFGYEGIKYAVDNGVKIINCSWGGSNYTALGKSTIEYAVAHGVLVVCAAGNNNSGLPHYPSGYTGTLSVAAISSNDQRSSYSNYGYNVDVASPGDNIYSTWKPNTYTYLDGTSMASPLVAGLAGLVKSKFPSYTRQQILEQIRVTTTNIDNANPNFVRKIGKGRINAYAAVNTPNAISLRASDIKFSDAEFGNGNAIFEPGEIIAVKVKFKNILTSCPGYTVNLTLSGSGVTIQNGTYTTPAMNMGDSCDNYSAPFKIKVESSATQNQKVEFFLTYTYGTYSDYQYTSTFVNQPTGWQLIPVSTTGDIWGMCYIDLNNIWISASNGDIFRSNDGGYTFSSAGNVGEGAYTIAGIDANTAVVATGPSSGDGKIVRTTNGGTTWTQVYTASGAWFNFVDRLSDNELWALSDPINGNFHIVRSTDAGVTWTLASNLPAAPASNVYGANNSFYRIGNVLWFGTGGASGATAANRVYKSTSGANGPWTYSTTTAQYSGALAFSSPNGNGVCAFWQANNQLNRSSNGGTAWTNQTTTNTGLTRGLDYLQGTNTVYAACTTGVAKSTDNGATWALEALPAGLPGTPNAIRFSQDGSSAIVAGTAGLILRKSGSGLTGSVTVTSPVGGENWLVGSTHNITWNSANISALKIELSTNNGGSWTVITTGTPAPAGSYSWTVPDAVSSTCKIKLTDPSNPATTSTSPASFTISTPGPAISWQRLINVKDNGNENMNLTFGTAPTATDGIDAALGEQPLPPMPPAGVFDARFELPVNPADYSLKDYRNDTSHAINWVVKFQPGASGYPMTLSWNPSTLPAGIFKLKDMVTGSIINIDMKTQSSYTLTNTGISGLKIEFVKTICVDVPLTSGWNILSVPLTAPNMGASVLFPLATSPAWGYYTNYYRYVTLTTGIGFWLRYPQAAVINICGSPAEASRIDLVAGWNLIGIYNVNAPVAGITTMPAGILTTPFYSYNGTYISNDTLKVGKGYWVKSSGPGVINLFSGSLSKNNDAVTADINKEWNKILVSDAAGNSAALYLANSEGNFARYEMPPVPPEGVFDVRYNSQRNVEAAGTASTIQINSAVYPVYVKIEGANVRIKDAATNGKLINQLAKSGNGITIQNPAVTAITVESVTVPTAYELCQNYPNPFNPATSIKFSLPEKANVELYIYNQIGEKVATLVNGEREAGTYELEWNAGKYSSGIYFYELKTEKFRGTRKLILMK